MSTTNAQVGHLWANGQRGRSSNGNLSTNGVTLWSYSTPIANMVTAPNGGQVALITTASYSITTTGKHMPAAWRGVDYGRMLPTFTVPSIGAMGGRLHGPSGVDHEANMAHLIGVYRNAVTQGAKYDPESRPYVATTCGEYAETVMRYSALFGVPVPEPICAPEDLRVAIEEYAAKEAARNTPEAIAKREREREARRRRKEAREERERLAREAALAERWAMWRRGEYSGYVGPLQDGTAAVRVVGRRLETSLGASCPLEHAKRIFKLCQMQRAKGEALAFDGAMKPPAGSFRVDRIEADGGFQAGCHRFAWGEIEACAKSIGLA